jgi:hypothetical protein
MTVGRDSLTKAETVTVAAIEAGVSTLVEAREIIAEFHLMIRRKTEAGLIPWIERARASLVASCRFVCHCVRHHVNGPIDLEAQDHRSVPESPDQSKLPQSEGNAPLDSGLGFLSITASIPTPDAGTPGLAFVRSSNQTRRTSLAEVTRRTPPSALSVAQTTQQFR